MEFKKNDILTIDIEDMGHDGEGIGKAEGYTLFVKDTVIGDRAEVKIMKAKKIMDMPGCSRSSNLLRTEGNQDVLLQGLVEAASCNSFLMKNSWNLRRTKFWETSSGSGIYQYTGG